MRPLITTAQINAELRRLLRDCISCQIAVAWAGTGFDAFDTLVRNRRKIERMVIGTHFYQTDPRFIEEFMSQPEVVRFRLNPDGVFHPKIYLFDQPDGAWECIIGSANFTNGGMRCNDEVALLVGHGDVGACETLAAIDSAIDGYWQGAGTLTAEEVERYAEAHKRRQPVLRDVQGGFGRPDAPGDDGGRPVAESELLRKPWAAFFHEVREESGRSSLHSMKGRLAMLRNIRALFQKSPQLAQMQQGERQRVAGLVRGKRDGIDYYWFGRMSRVKNFKDVVENRCQPLSLALDAIPATGNVSREAYMEYVERYKGAFPSGGCGIGTATRLLAMKRPDWFLCLDAANKKRLCDDFKIPKALGYEQYWDSIIARIIDPQTIWWNAPEPQDSEEREVWRARVAFLDAIYYDDMATGG